MASTHDSGLGGGVIGKPQRTIQEYDYHDQADKNEKDNAYVKPPHYSPSPKHEEGHNWGSNNPIKTNSEGQHLLDTGYRDGRQIYNVTNEGTIVKFQPDNTPENGYHPYEVNKPRDIPHCVLKKMLNDGKITKKEYKKLRKGK